MKIAIDYDDTFTEDPELWRLFMQEAEARGHQCYIVTCRIDNCDNRDEVIGERVGGVSENTGLPCHRHYLTSMSPKRWFMEEKGIKIDIWIDDCPESVKEGR